MDEEREPIRNVELLSIGLVPDGAGGVQAETVIRVTGEDGKRHAVVLPAGTVEVIARDEDDDSDTP